VVAIVAIAGDGARGKQQRLVLLAGEERSQSNGLQDAQQLLQQQSLLLYIDDSCCYA
jgi:hypothetical protein